MSNIWFLLNKTNDAYEIDLGSLPVDPPPSPPPPPKPKINNVAPYRPSFLLPTKKSIKRESLKRTLTVPPELMKMKQGSAAMHLGIPASTFSKRWRESLPERKWPFRTHRKLEKSMKMLLVLQRKGHDVTKDMERLRAEQRENLLPAEIHLYEEANDANNITFVPENPSSSSSSSTPSTPSSSNTTLLQLSQQLSPIQLSPSFASSPSPSPPSSFPSTPEKHEYRWLC